MIIATWNLNNRVGRTPFRPEAAAAACALGADVLILTEYYPQEHHQAFLADLISGGYTTVLESTPPVADSNRTLVAARVFIEHDPLELSAFDEQLPANLVAFRIPEAGLRVLGIRVPWYTHKQPTHAVQSWNWIEQTASELALGAAVIIGDLNVRLNSEPKRGGEHFRRLLVSGWTRAEPVKPGGLYLQDYDRWSEIDHALCSKGATFLSARYGIVAGPHTLAGSSEALSDHSALVVDCRRDVDL